MRDVSLRWGLGMGAVSAALGTVALILGSLVEPVQQVTTAEAAALAIFVRGIFVLVTLGVALGLAYYAGLRAERARLIEDAEPRADDAAVAGSVASEPNSRSVSVLAGGVTMFCYWLITSLYMFVLPSSTQPSTATLDVLSFVENRLLFGIIFVLFGLGLGGLGGRAPAARLLLDRIVKPSAGFAVVPVGAAGATGAMLAAGSATVAASLAAPAQNGAQSEAQGETPATTATGPVEMADAGPDMASGTPRDEA